MSEFTESIATMLAGSRRAHLLYHQHLPRTAAGPGGVQVEPGEASTARAYLQEAARLRAQAQAIDPHHESPAWSDEAGTFPHDDLMLFYLQQLAK